MPPYSACPATRFPEPATVLTGILRRSRLAAAFLDFAATFDLQFVFTAQEAGARYNKANGHILLNPQLPLADQVLLSVRELRRLWQHRQGALLHPLDFQADQAILINRAQTADLAVAMVRVAWELQLAGARDAWTRLEESSLGDMTRAFAREANQDFRTLNNGIAACAVFETWFLSDRCRAEDRKLIQSMLADHHGAVFDTTTSLLSVSRDLICALGSVPFGKNYLAGHAATIISDAVFTEVRDRANANFLWFIKFERSFREEAAGKTTNKGDTQDMATKTNNTQENDSDSALTAEAGADKKISAPKDIHRKNNGVTPSNIVELPDFTAGPENVRHAGGAQIITFIRPSP